MRSRRRKKRLLPKEMKKAWNDRFTLPNGAGGRCGRLRNVTCTLSCASLDSCDVCKDTGGVQRRQNNLIHHPASGGVMHMCTKKMNISQTRCARSGTAPL